MAKKFELNFKLGAQMAASFAKTMTNAQSAMGNLGTHVASLNKQAGDNKKILDMRDAVGKASFEYTVASTRVEVLGKQMKRVQKPSAKMTAEFKSAERNAEQAGKKLETLRNRLDETERSAGTTHRSAAQLASEQSRLERSAERAAGAQKRLNKALDDREKNKQDQSNIRSSMMKTAAAGAAFALPVKMAANFHQQMAEVAAKGSLTADQQAVLSKQARELGESTIYSASQAAEGMTYLAIAGMNAAEIGDSIPAMLDLAAASGLDLASTADIATDIMAGFGLKAAEAGRVADVLAKTSVSSNTNVEMLGDTMKYVAPVARDLGMSLEETSAMAGLLANVGIKSSQAGTTLKSMMLKLSAPTSKATKHLKKLKIELEDDEKNMRSMVDVMADLAAATENMGNVERMGIISDIFGREPAAGMAELIGQGGTDAIANFVDIMENAEGTAAKIADDLSNAPIGKFKQLQSAAEELAIVVGETLLPAVLDVVTNVTEMIMKISDWAKEHPRLTNFVFKSTAALIGFRMVILTTRYAVSVFRGVLIGLRIALAKAQAAQILFASGSLKMRAAQIAAAGASKVMTAATWLFSGALWANPITWVVAGIIGLVAAGYLLWKNWDKVSEFLTDMWQKIKDGVGAAMEWVKNAFVGAWEAVMSFLGDISLFDSGKKLLQTLIDGIKAMGGKLVDTVKGAFGKVRDLLPFSDAKAGPFAQLTASGAAIMETLGKGIKKAGSNPLVSPFVDAAGGMLGTAKNIGGALGVGGNGGGMTVNLDITQNITINGDSANVRSDAQAGARQGAQDLAKEIEVIMNRQRRLAFGG